jgi:hypothetical protein
MYPRATIIGEEDEVTEKTGYIDERPPYIMPD